MTIKEKGHNVEEITDTLTELIEKGERIIAADRNKIVLTKKQDKIIRLFWHPIDKEVMDSVPFLALYHLNLIEIKNHRYQKHSKNSFWLTLKEMQVKNIFDELPPNTDESRDIRLTENGRKYVEDIFPKHHPMYLAIKDIAKHKVRIVVAVVAFSGSVLTILKYISA